jgi:hypothetical protein
MKYFKTTIYLFIFAAAAALEIFVFADAALAADYYKSGAMVSTNLLSGLTDVGDLTQFNITASIPSGASATVQFSRNKSIWYDRLNNAHASTTLADGSNNLDISGLGWSGPLFYYKLNFFTSSSTQTASVTEVTVNYDQSSETSYIYYNQGTMVSKNLLDGKTDVGDLTQFNITASIPSGASATVQFSRNKSVWYDRLGNAHASTTLADGSNNLDISGLGWSGPLFYYKLNFFNNDYTKTPSVTFAEIIYTAGSGRIYFKQGAMVSENLIATLIATTSLVTLDYFGYNLTSLPASTTAYIQFGTTTDYWYGANGALWATTTLEAGEHFSETTAISLSNLNWPTNTFYYKVTFETLNPTATPVLSEIQLAYETVRPIYRSVGPSNTTAIASSTGATLDISGSTATFSTGMPANMGVGDVIVYRKSGSGEKDSLAFIHGRASDTVYTVKDVNGRIASSTSASTNWQVFRAYTSLYEAESGDENDGLPDNLEEFETWTDGKNLASSTEQWNIACYADAVDTTRVTIDNWTTTADNYIKIYTPYLASEVGTSQRHKGKWDESKYSLQNNDNGDAILINTNYTVVDGLQVYYYNGGYMAIDIVGGGVKIINNIINPSQNANNVHGVYFNFPISSGYAYNNIIYNADDCLTAGGEVDVVFYFYNNTLYNCASGIFASYATVKAKNNLANNCSTCFNTYSSGNFTGSSNNISSDTTAPGTNSKTKAAVQFVNAANKDFHLRVGDSAARGGGANLTNDSDLPFSTDIDNESRPETGAWDIGADEVARTTVINSPRGIDTSLSQGLVGYWTFDGQDMDWGSSSAEALDRSGQSPANNGDVNGAVPVPGISGQALSFDGEDDYVDTASDPLVGATAMTFSLWVKQGSVGSEHGMAGTKTTWSGAGFMMLDWLGAWEAKIQDASYSFGAIDSNWHHLSFTYGGNIFILYKDGSQVSSNEIGAKTLPNNALRIGGRLDGDYLFDGLIDDVRIYNRALEASEIAEQYAAGAARLTVNTPITGYGAQGGLVGSWTFNGQDTTWTSATAGTTNDLSGNGNTGTMTNMSRSTSPAPGISGQALSFDGEDDVVQVNQSSSINNLDTLTLSALIYLNSYGKYGYGRILSKEGIGFKWYVDATAYTSSGFSFEAQRWATDGIWSSPSNSILTGRWYHVAVTYDYSSLSNTPIFYINGSQVVAGLAQPPGGAKSSETDDLWIGDNDESLRTFNGLIDEVRIYNRVLTADEILQLYRLGSRKASF